MADKDLEAELLCVIEERDRYKRALDLDGEHFGPPSRPWDQVERLEADNTRLRAALQSIHDTLRGCGTWPTCSAAATARDALAPPAVEAPRELVGRSTLPPCDHDECSRMQCMRPAAEASGEAAPECPGHAHGWHSDECPADAAPREDAPSDGQFTPAHTYDEFTTLLADIQDYLEGNAVAPDLLDRFRAFDWDDVATPAAPPATRDESVPPPGWHWETNEDEERTGVCLRLQEYTDGPDALAEAWRIYDAEHGYAPMPREAPSLPAGFKRREWQEGWMYATAGQRHVFVGRDGSITAADCDAATVHAVLCFHFLSSTSDQVGGGS